MLGVERLAALLVAEAASNRQLIRALELALDADKSIEGLAFSIRKRLTAIRQAASAISAHKAREVMAGLDRLKSSILTDVATANPLLE